ncbi:MAG: hypothetical protein L3J35_11300 [Bacteroidales bacterium]|nr:hypothetical protein [Bacteroidales bacterium]
MVNSSFDYQKNILITRFEGNVTLKEVVDYINATRLNQEYPRKLRILTDSSKSTMLMVPDDLQHIVEANNESLKEYTYIIDAIVLENPKDTALSYLYKEISKNKNYFFQLFSTNKAARKWLENFEPVL